MRAATYVKRRIGHCRKCKAELPIWFQLGGDLDGIERYIDQVLPPLPELVAVGDAVGQRSGVSRQKPQV
ncbi:MAG: hypothetical protein P8045_01145 [Candidatus Thiodiazotropha sp.]